MSFNTVFRNFGHAIATAAKYTATGIKDVVLFANKAQVVAPEVELLAGALAGPLGTQVSTLAFHALGDVATAIEPLGDDITADVAAKGLNVTMDTKTVNDIKAILPVLKGIIQAVGGKVPAVK